ncbi:MAG: hypothetical protein HZA95_01590 [Candidatus Vogelbacteria bacterium]|nr:hypothetical protein [Candidatus Vogelbacteria bacterium]
MPFSLVDIDSIFYAVYRVLLWIGALFDMSTSKSNLPDVNSEGFVNSFIYIEAVLVIIGALGIAAIVYFMIEKKKIEQNLSNTFAEKYRSKKVGPQKNVIWDSIQKHLATDSNTEWKLAVIEADKILDEATVKRGFVGDTLGERLKNADESVLSNLEDAWEAHKIRNRIAHEPGYHLTRRDAQRAISMFERVFKELNVI